MTIKKFCKLSLLSASIFAVSCGSGGDPVKSIIPDYSKFNDQFTTWAYASPINGKYKENGIEIDMHTDFRTVDRYKEYKESGLNTMMLQINEDPYTGSNYETSQLKKNLDNCLSAGISRCIITDYNFYLDSQTQGDLIGQHGKYKTEEEMETFYKNEIAPFKDHPCFYGFMLMDEPRWNNLQNYGIVYKMIKKLLPNAYIESCLLPLQYSDSTKALYVSNPVLYETYEEAYEAYVEDFIANTGCEKILMDSYPFKGTKNDPLLQVEHIKGLNLLANICKKHNIEFDAVSQTTAYNNYNSAGELRVQHRAPDETLMKWQTNLYMGFGVKKFAYFTYWRKKDNSMTGEWFVDGTSFISQNGTKTALYTAMQKIHGNMQKMAPTLMQYQFVNAKTYTTDPKIIDVSYLSKINNKTPFKVLTEVSPSASSAIVVTEHYDSNQDLNLYMLMNAYDPGYVYSEGNPDYLTNTTKLTFKNYNKVMQLKDGEIKTLSLNNSQLEVTLTPGEAVYLIPYYQR